MEPFNARLHEVIRARVETMDRETLDLAVMLLALKSPASVIRALDAAAEVERDVDETLLQRPPES